MIDSAATAPLKGRVALVTGGSRGLGKAIALGLAKAGADVVVTSRKFENCQSVCQEIEALGRHALPYACHVGRWNDLPGLVDAAYAQYGRIDILVNNAGSSPMFESLADVSEKLWDSTFAVNLKGPFRLSVLVGQRMKAAGRGAIINISAYGALRPMPYIAPYAAAKIGVNNITVSLAHELAPEVRVNAIMPGAFRTDSSRNWEPGKWESMASLGRLGLPEEIVGAVLYFAGDAASFTTGTILRVDGGIV